MLLWLATQGISSGEEGNQENGLKVGWASTEIAPPRQVILGGMPYARVTSEVSDPLTATVLVLESCPPGSSGVQVIMVSCDLRNVSDALRASVRNTLKAVLPEVQGEQIIFNATHTHTAPPLGDYGVELQGMGEEEYVEFASAKIVESIGEAWQSRDFGGVSYGLSNAVVGRNRLVALTSGKSVMYGKTEDWEFSHIEGYEDHSVNLLYTWNRKGELTGVVINAAVPSQVSEHAALISADFWHETRELLREKLGSGLFIFPQCSAAGDQSPRALWDKRAHERMLEIQGRSLREEIAVRLTEAVMSILPVMEKHIEWNPELKHTSRILPLPRRLLPREQLDQVLEAGRPHQELYEQMLQELEANPQLIEDHEWLRTVTRAFWHARRASNAQIRYQEQQTNPDYPTEVHFVRIGDMAIATNPFELYLDYGVQIKSRSPAVQTFLVQLAGGGTYLPTDRSIAGGAYGAAPGSTHVGPPAGEMLVKSTVKELEALWSE